MVGYLNVLNGCVGTFVGWAGGVPKFIGWPGSVGLLDGWAGGVPKLIGWPDDAAESNMREGTGLQIAVIEFCGFKFHKSTTLAMAK